LKRCRRGSPNSSRWKPRTLVRGGGHRAVNYINKYVHGNLVKIYNRKAELSQIRPNTIIKCDIEGAEHKLFTYEADLSNVYKMQIEYHFGLKKLPTILKAKGFKIMTHKAANTITAGEYGWIHAWRGEQKFKLL
ncbi:MAG: hypothetical protein KGH77_06090, partial [Candidatus Micrarchaeota archaeon]|nr:hypothetical protein [Candidatus Micrarchaeota archaeon]